VSFALAFPWETHPVMLFVIVLCAGCVLGLAFNVFALLSFAAVFAAICLAGLVALGAPHPLLVTASALVALNVGYATGAFGFSRALGWNRAKARGAPPRAADNRHAGPRL